MEHLPHIPIRTIKNSTRRRLIRRARQVRKSRLGQCQRLRKSRTSSANCEKVAALLREGISPNQVQHKIGIRKVVLKFPEILSVRDHPDEIAEFLGNLDRAFFELKAKSVLIDHSALKEATPDGVLVLIAELDRITSYSPGTLLQANFEGTCKEVMAVFERVGYLKNFGIEWTACEEEKRLFIKETRGIGTVAEKSGQIIKEFTSQGFLSPSEGRWLGSGLVECMDNTCDHAYRINILHKAKMQRRLRKNWWLLAYTNPENSEISFAFYDQGAGMPNTLRFKKRDNLHIPIVRELIGRTDEELIVAAFMAPFTRTMEGNRGVGLPTMRMMVEKSPEGELFVQSNQSRVFLRPGTKISSQRCQIPLAGTLLVWKIRRGVIQPSKP